MTTQDKHWFHCDFCSKNYVEATLELRCPSCNSMCDDVFSKTSQNTYKFAKLSDLGQEVEIKKVRGNSSQVSVAVNNERGDGVKIYRLPLEDAVAYINHCMEKRGNQQ